MRTREVDATATWQRVVAAAVLGLAGLLGLPLTALVLDRSPSTEQLILPVHLLAVALVGAGLARWLPAGTRADGARAARPLVGAAWGLLAAGIGLAVFWFLLNGVGGA